MNPGSGPGPQIAEGTSVFPTVSGDSVTVSLPLGFRGWVSGLTVTAGISKAFRRRLGRWTELSTRKSRPHAEAGLKAKNSSYPLAHANFLVVVSQGMHCPHSHF